MTPAEQVVYRYDNDRKPAITYHSHPHGCTGGAETLDEARKLYRSNMIQLLGTSGHELPHKVEHFEAIVAGMWVRDRIGAVHRDPIDDRMFLQRLLEAGPDQDRMRAHVRELARRGCNPVVVLTEPGESMGTLFDQMRVSDVLVVVHPDSRCLLGWVTLFGGHAVSAEAAATVLHLPDARMMPIASLTGRYSDGDARAVRVPAHHLWPAESLAS
jgi:hypothetical protein